jgi:hypothetical protein
MLSSNIDKEFPMNTDPTTELRRGIQRLIVRKWILRHFWSHLGWSFLPLVATLGVGYTLDSIPVPYPFVVLIAFMSVVVAPIIAMKAKNSAIDVLDRLNGLAIVDWFVVLSVSRSYTESHPTIILLRDIVGGEHKVYHKSGVPNKVDLEDLDNLRCQLACLTHPKWQKVLREMHEDFPKSPNDEVNSLKPQGFTMDA